MALRNKYKEDIMKHIRQIDGEFRPHKIDMAAISDLLKCAKRQDAINSWEEERRRLERAGINENIPRPKYQYLGQQSINDIPAKAVWQQMLYDQTGKVAGRFGKPTKCPHCGVNWCFAWPPPRCPNCGKPTWIETGELDLRR